MTVRAWFTISTVVLVALVAAVVLKLTAPTPPPAIVARVGDTRLPGALYVSCWPQRSGNAKCQEPTGSPKGDVTIPRRGTLRVVVAYPVQPKRGNVRIYTGGRTTLRSEWKRSITYELEPGRYQMLALALYPNASQVQYIFRFRVR
jgi:hypothetical protein